VDFSTYFRFLIALIFVLALIGVLAWAARRYGFLRGTVRPRNGERRLQVVEIAPVDSKRRLLLLRRDGTEHLVLLGPTTDVVIESGIVRSNAPAARGEAAE
jgi:flagellar protein FliO/FliZ